MASSLLPYSLRARRRLSLRGFIWVYSFLFIGLASLLLVGVGAWLGGGHDILGDTAAVLLLVVGSLGFMFAVFLMFEGLGSDRYSFAGRRKRAMRDRIRRRRDHAAKPVFRDLKGRYPQFAVEASASGQEIRFTLLRFDPPDVFFSLFGLVPWVSDRQQWSASSGRWQVEGHVLRVSDLRTPGLMEAYCEAAEAARALELDYARAAAERLAAEGIALAFSPPSSATADIEALRATRERVFRRRLLNSGD